MTFRFRLAVIFSAILFMALSVGAVSPARAQDETQKVCQDIKPIQTKINVTYDEVPVAYELGKSKQQIVADYIKNYKTVMEKKGMDLVWLADDLKVAGVSMAVLGVVTDYHMRSDRVDSMGAYHCPYFGEIDIGVFYLDSIVIPSEIPQNTCKFNVVNKHELKHTQSNKAMVDQYIIRLEDDIRKMLPHIEGGYVGSDKVEGRFEEMKISLEDAIIPYLKDSIKRDAQSINAQIDVPEEYQNLEKLFNLCDVRDAYYRKKALEEGAGKKK